MNGHHHHVADALAASTHGIRATRISLAVLMGTAIVQFVIAVVSGSVALLADTVHNVGDALTSVPLWIAFLAGRRAQTRRYPYGYRRAEDLVGVLIVLMIALSAAYIGWESVRRLLDPTPMTHTGWVLAAGVVGVLGNEIAARYRIRVGRQIGSAALVADGYHARTDTIASFAVIAAVIGTWAGFPLLDPLVGLVITAMILWIVKHTAAEVFRRLMDGVDPSVLADIEAVAHQVPGVIEVSAVRARWIGHRLVADLAIGVAADRSVAEGHAIGEEVRHRLLHDIRNLDDAWVHVNPSGHEDDPHATTRHHKITG